MMESLSEKLKALGITTGEKNKKIIPTARYPIENFVKGERLSFMQGNIFMSTSMFPYDFKQGFIQLKNNILHSSLLKVSKIKGDLSSLKELLFLDTETTGLSGGTGTMAFLVGLGKFTEEGFVIKQYFLENPEQEYSLLSRIVKEADGHKIVVSYNGASFDIPLLNSRFALNHIESPFKSFQHLDLLHLSRKIWKLRLNFCKLIDVESNVLGFKRIEKEVPGWMVPQIYFDFIKTQDARPLNGVFYHNCMDVLSLAAIFTYASDLLTNIPSESHHAFSTDLLSIAKLYEKTGKLDEARLFYDTCFQKEIPEEITAKAHFRYGVLSKRLGNYEKALSLWEISFACGDVSAAIELAKYYEHKQKSIELALGWVEKAYSLLSLTSNGKTKVFEDDLKRRKKRLLFKLRNCD